MRRVHFLLFAVVAFLSTSSKPLFAQDNPPSNEGIVKRLDEILKRLDGIEARLVVLESEVDTVEKWSTDQSGVLRDSRGRAIGRWGTDDIKRTPRPIRR